MLINVFGIDFNLDFIPLIVSPPAAAPSPTPAAEQTRSPTEEAALEPVRGGGIALRFKPSVVDQAKATMNSAPPTKISILNSVKVRQQPCQI